MNDVWAAFTDDRPNAVKRRTIRTPSQALAANLLAVRNVPGHTLWRPLAIVYTITCSAVAGTRLPDLRYVVDGGMAVQLENNASLAASQATTFNYVNGYHFAVTQPTICTQPLPDIILEPGHIIQIFNTGGQAGDTLTNWDLWVEELFLEEGAPPAAQVSIDLAAGGGTFADEIEHAVERALRG